MNKLESKFIPVGVLRVTEGPTGVRVAVEGEAIGHLANGTILFGESAEASAVELLMQERVAVANLAAMQRGESMKPADRASAAELAIAVILASRKKIDLAMTTVQFLREALAQSEALRYAQDDAIVEVGGAGRTEALDLVRQAFASFPELETFTVAGILRTIDRLKGAA